MSFLSFFFFFNTRHKLSRNGSDPVHCLFSTRTKRGRFKQVKGYLLFQEMLFNMFIVILNGNAKIEFDSVLNPHSWNLYKLHYNLNSFVPWDDITYKLISLKSNKINLFVIKSISKISEKCIFIMYIS